MSLGPAGPHTHEPRAREIHVLAPHAIALATKLDDSDWRVRKAALDTLGKLTPEDLVTREQGGK